MLKQIKDSGEDQAEKVLKGREFYGGNFLDSLNPLKQVTENFFVWEEFDFVFANFAGLAQRAQAGPGHRWRG